MLRTTGFDSKERVVVADMIQAYCVENIKRYDEMKNKLNSVRAQPIRPVSGISERDRVFDQYMILSIKLQREEFEEGEIREEDV